MKLRILRHDDCERGTHHALLALDIENNSDTGAFICAGLYGKIDHRHGHNHDKTQTEINEYFSNLADLHEYLLSLKKGSCRLIFYNLSYDIVYLRSILAAPDLDRKGNIRPSVLMVGTRVITAKLKNGIECLDLFNHTCEGSLEDWSRYCKFEDQFNIKKVDLHDLHARVMSDAALTYRLGEFIEDFYYDECGIPLQLTVGASALKIFTTKYFTDIWQRDNEELSQFERQSYYGGRTEIFKRGELYTYSYDINSTYLSIMRDCELPDITTAHIRQNGKRVLHDLGKDLSKHLAIIECTVSSPDNLYIGVLPVRVDNKLTFPIGKLIHGVWTSIELIAAVAAKYKIIEVMRYVFYTHTRKYFHEFALFIWDKRIKYRELKNDGMDKMIKRVGNSLYGKFGERHQTNTECPLSQVDFEIPEGSEIFEYLGETWVRLQGDQEPSEHEFPCIPAFITAYARLKLLDGMQKNERALVYTDTDSIKLTSPAKDIEIGNNLGAWKFEYEGSVIYYRCKFYGDKHKGVPKTCKMKDHSGKCQCTDILLCPYPLNYPTKETCIRAFIKQKTKNYIKYGYKKPTREREAMRANTIPNVWHEHNKILQFEDDKRYWIGNDSKPKSIFYDGLINILLTLHK
jgi:DNA polymerase type B, organellar and viral